MSKQHPTGETAMATYREVYDLSASIRQWTGRITKMTLIGTIIIYGGRVFGWW